MSMIKNYWWVFALVIGAFLIYWFMFRTPAKPAVAPAKPKANPACPMSVEEWEAKVAQTEAQIDNNPDWKAFVTAQATQMNLSYASRRKTNAVSYMENELALCNPTKAPVA